MEIFKVQVDVTGKRVLIYNEDKSVIGDFPKDESLDMMPLTKRYYFGELDTENNIVNLGNQVEEQDW